MKHRNPITNRASPDAVVADWLVRRARGLTVEEEAEFARWLAADPAHRERFAELEKTWQMLDALDEVTLPDGRALDYDLPPPVNASTSVWSSSWRFPALTLAAAALALVAWFSFRPVTPGSILRRNVATQTAEFEKIELPDGSVIHINTESAVAIAYTATERRVTLTRGEANFNVATDRARPFIVTVAGIDVRAVGTVFDVRFKSEAVDVFVTEGKVRVDDAAQGHSLLAVEEPVQVQPSTGGSMLVAPLLRAGQRATIRLQRGATSLVTVAPMTADEASHELAWQERRLEFFDTPLAEAVAEFNRYNRHKLVIVDPALAGKRFGGSIRADNGDAFVRVLESRFGVVAERKDDETLLRAAR